MTTWYVVAGNIAEHWDFCNLKKREIAQELANATAENINDVLYERAYVYVESAEMLRNFYKSRPQVLFVGTYRQRPDIDEIETIAKHDAEIIAPVRTKDLTDEEIESVVANLGFAQLSPIEVARAAIAADREKNNAK